jgi:hypothetical protein
MTLYKRIIITLLFIYEAIAFSNMNQKLINKLNDISLFTNNKHNKHSNIKQIHLTKLNLHRRNLFGIASIFPYIFTKPAIASSVAKEKTIEELRKEALNIIDIIEVQKNTINLPSLNDNTNDNNNTNNDNNSIVDSKTKIMIDAVLNNIMSNFKKNGKIDPEKSVSNLQKYCSETNIIKYTNVRRITTSFQDGKYGLLLGKFINYEIINYEKDVDNNSDDKNNIYYNVDMKVNAEYKTMLQNSIQFNDMHYPKNRDNNNVCYVIYRWSFRRYEDANLYLEGCFLVPSIKN